MTVAYFFGSPRVNTALEHKILTHIRQHRAMLLFSQFIGGRPHSVYEDSGMQRHVACSSDAEQSFAARAEIAFAIPFSIGWRRISLPPVIVTTSAVPVYSNAAHARGNRPGHCNSGFL